MKKEKILARPPRPTTDLRTLLRNEKFWDSVFTWGRITDIHLVGPYAVVECQWWADNQITGSSIVGTPDPREVRFHPYVDGKDIRQNYSNLEAALVGAIAYKFDQTVVAADYFMRMIGGTT